MRYLDEDRRDEQQIRKRRFFVRVLCLAFALCAGMAAAHAISINARPENRILFDHMALWLVIKEQILAVGAYIIYDVRNAGDTIYGLETAVLGILIIGITVVITAMIHILVPFWFILAGDAAALVIGAVLIRLMIRDLM